MEKYFVNCRTLKMRGIQKSSDKLLGYRRGKRGTTNKQKEVHRGDNRCTHNKKSKAIAL